MRIKDKVDKRLNDTFTDNLCGYLESKFPGVKFESTFSLCDMRMVTTWDSKDPKVCEEIKKYAEAYEAAYSMARQEVWAA